MPSSRSRFHYSLYVTPLHPSPLGERAGAKGCCLEEVLSETQEGTRAKEEGRGFYAPAPYLSPLAQAIAQPRLAQAVLLLLQSLDAPSSSRVPLRLSPSLYLPHP